jgi:tetratricopeptide (TPR) repeat protein
MTISVKELLDALGGKLSEAAIIGLTGRLRDLSPAALLSLAHQAEIRIAGDGNVIGSNNQVFVLKGEGLQELARLFRAASERGQALHQLPPPPGDFTGRAKELEELMQAIEKGGVTISGLRGMGGIGKTALALKLADQLRERYPDAQIYLDLKGTSEKPLTTAEAMAHVVRAYHPAKKLPDDEAELAARYHSVLDGQRALLLMDNAANAAQVAPLAPPGSCVLLVTSRERFVLRGWLAKDLTTLAPEEARALLLTIACGPGAVVVVSPPLPCHPESRSDRDEGSPQLTLCPDSRAIARARDVAAHADEIASLCGYLPLALCAAGGMLAAREDLAPRRYAEQLRDERQRLERLGEEGVEISVEASFNLSYANLEAQAARVFRQLAVFPGSFDAAAEEVVCKDPEHARLSELLRRSLVEYDSTSERYWVHDLTRLFAASRRSDQERADAERQHAAHYLKVASAAHDLYLKGGDAILEGLRLFDTEWANIRAGQAWSAALVEEDGEACKLCSGYAGRTWHLLDLRLHPSEQIAWQESALVAARRLSDRRMEAVHLGNLGIAHVQLGKPGRGIEYYEQALAIHRDIGDRRGEGNSLGNLGTAYLDIGEPGRAIKCCEQALAIHGEIGDRREQGQDLGNLGNAYLAFGDARRALDSHKQALAIECGVGDRRVEGQILGSLGAIYLALGDPRRAVQHLERRITIAREIGDRRGEGIALDNLGNAYLALGEPRRAIDHHKQALAIEREIGDRRGEGHTLDNLGSAYSALGEPRRAIDHHEQSLAIKREIRDRRGEATALGNLGSAYLGLGQAHRAIDYHERALAIDRDICDRQAEGADLGNLGNVYLALGVSRRAVEYYNQQLVITREIGDRHGEGNALWNMSLALDQLGERAQAIASAQAALKIYVEIEDPAAEKVPRQLAEWGA